MKIHYFYDGFSFFCPGSPQALNPPLPEMWLPAVSFEESGGDFTAGRWCLCSCNESGPNVFLLPPWVGQSLHVCCCCRNMLHTFYQDCIFLWRLQHLKSLCDPSREWEGGWRGGNKVASLIPAASWLAEQRCQPLFCSAPEIWPECDTLGVWDDLKTWAVAAFNNFRTEAEKLQSSCWTWEKVCC